MPAPAPDDRLRADAIRVLAGWQAADGDQERLRRAYLEHLAEHADGVWRTCRPDHLTASALVVDGAGERTLLTLHRRLRRWLQTGGHCDPADDSLQGAALREATEESGIPGLVLDPVPLRLDRHAEPCGGAAGHHLDVQYLALAPADALERISAESSALEWFAFDALPEEADDSVRALVADGRRRLAQPSASRRNPAASETPSR